VGREDEHGSGRDQRGILEHTSCLTIPYWVLPEMNIELVFYR